jgi:hypothetical protein
MKLITVILTIILTALIANSAFAHGPSNYDRYGVPYYTYPTPVPVNPYSHCYNCPPYGNYYGHGRGHRHGHTAHYGQGYYYTPYNTYPNHYPRSRSGLGITIYDNNFSGSFYYYESNR